MTKFLGFFTALLVIFGLAFGAFRIYAGYQVDRDIDALIDRAQVSADSEDMLVHLKQLRTNMLAYGLDEGHSALIFKTPVTDFSLTFKAVNDLNNRLEQINLLPKNETAYQVALDDLRGTIRELPNPGDGYLWITYDVWYVPAGCVIGVIFVVFIGILE